MIGNQIKAYQQSQRLGLSRRQAEAMAFDKAANLLAAAAGKRADPEAYAEALRFNQMLWTLVQDGLLNDRGRLPERLKANLFSLSAYVDKQTVAAFARHDPACAQTLSAIARNVANGLMGRVDAEAA